MLKANKYKLSDVPQRYWDFAHKYGTNYQSKPYLDHLVASGKELFIIEVDEGDEIIGGAGIILSHKFLSYAYSARVTLGPVVKDIKRAGEVIEYLAAALKLSCLFFHVTVWPEYSVHLAETIDLSAWSVQEFESLHWDISGTMDSFWKELPKGKKSAINRARREGIIVEEIKTMEQVEQFYNLHLMSMSRGEITAKPISEYKALIARRKAGLAKGFLALHPKTSQPIASVILLLGMHGDASYLAVGHDHEYRKFGATDLLMWQCLEFLTSNGFKEFDLQGLFPGDSPRATGITHFKTSWAGSNGRRCPSYKLSRGNFGINPKLLQKVLFLLRKAVKTIIKPIKKLVERKLLIHNSISMYDIYPTFTGA
jgi:hypothetical protein